MAFKMDVGANRAAVKWSRSELVRRAAWGLIQPLFRFSPRPFFWGWRRFLLRLMGAKIGPAVRICPTVRITIPWHLRIDAQATVGEYCILYALGPIHIGSRTTVSQNSHLCAGSHDWRLASMPLLKIPITIGADTWICADAYIGPGVIIGDRVVVGARSVVVADVDPDTIVAGNPARKIGERIEVSEKRVKV